jgi:uncharacterized membrane protein YozB (DUF420 family)
MDWMMLPALNATLNGIAAVCLLVGLFFIKRKERGRHKVAMLTAVTCSILFLTSYLIYHFGHAGLTRFTTEGWPKTLYFTILWTHTPLAALVAPLIVITLKRALKSNFTAHSKLARWISITGERRDTLSLRASRSLRGEAILIALHPSFRFASSHN